MTAWPDSMAVSFRDFSPDPEFARHMDTVDPLAAFRDAFELPRDEAGRPVTYLVGNSLGPMPRTARALVNRELDAWGGMASEARFRAPVPWYRYHEMFREPLARLVGANPEEVVAMNGLTVNLHLMLASFWRPEGRRTRILMEAGAFPSDTYAIESHVRVRGLDPAVEVIKVQPAPGAACLETQDLVQAITGQGDRLALVLVGGLNYFTGQVLDMQAITRAAHGVGALCGLDLAHAVGNVPMDLHAWNCDFACWCSYKYLNAGSGSVAGCFVHRRHGADLQRPRFTGWWGNDPQERLRMLDTFTPALGADGWQVTNPPILSCAPLKASLDLFDQATLAALRQKSKALTGYLEFMLRHAVPQGCSVLTPAQPQERGAQLSIRIPGGARQVAKALHQAGFWCDFREPDVVRASPAPFFNRFAEVHAFAHALGGVLRAV
jgi:kynureninase